jgi:hypothetical protein
MEHLLNEFLILKNLPISDMDDALSSLAQNNLAFMRRETTGDGKFGVQATQPFLPLLLPPMTTKRQEASSDEIKSLRSNAERFVSFFRLVSSALVILEK